MLGRGLLPIWRPRFHLSRLRASCLFRQTLARLNIADIRDIITRYSSTFKKQYLKWSSLSLFSLVYESGITPSILHATRSSNQEPLQGNINRLKISTHLCLDKKASSGHLLGLFNAHGCKYGWSNISQNATRLLEAPALWRVCHDEGDLIRRMRSLGSSLFGLHLLSVSKQLSALFLILT